jgi:hypothetical protein
VISKSREVQFFAYRSALLALTSCWKNLLGKAASNRPRLVLENIAEIESEKNDYGAIPQS